jgi:hypothetical protein
VLTEHERNFTRVCFAQSPPEDALEALGARRDRWLLYRDMVRARLRRMIEAGLPRTVEALGRPAYGKWYDRFLDEAPPRSRYIREVVPEFVAHVKPRWKEDSTIPAWVCDLAEYELAKWEAGWVEGEVIDAGELTFEKIPVVNPTLRTLQLRHRVHEKLPLGADYPEQPVILGVFRREDDKVSTWVLTERTLWLLQELTRGELTTTEAAKKMAAERGLAIDEKFATMIGSTLADLLESGMLLGAREAT